MIYCGELKQNQAITIMLGQFFQHDDAKLLLDSIDPADVTCKLIKDASVSTLTLTASGGDNNINLIGPGLITLTLTADNLDTTGNLIISFENTTEGSEAIFPCSFCFNILSPYKYDEKYVGPPDYYYDKTTNPWQLVIHKQGDPNTVYSRKNAYDKDNAAVTSINQLVMKLQESQ